MPSTEQVLGPGVVLANRYRLEHLVGEGGMGQVYRAVDSETSESRAIKIMLTHLADQADIERFKREASVSISLQHPNIVTVFDIGTTDDKKPFIVMEYLIGQNLAEVISHQRKLPFARFKDIFIKICDALSFAHENNVVHRDVKPGNIMLVNSKIGEVVKLVDFGIARICQKTGEVCPTTANYLKNLSTLTGSDVADMERLQQLTQPGEVFGSPLYLSPEQCRGEQADCRSEVFSLGCMMYECLSGMPPLKGPTAMDTVMLRLNEDAPSLAEILPSETISSELVALVARALAHEPDDRFQSVRELGDCLQGID